MNGHEAADASRDTQQSRDDNHDDGSTQTSVGISADTSSATIDSTAIAPTVGMVGMLEIPWIKYLNGPHVTAKTINSIGSNTVSTVLKASDRVAVSQITDTSTGVSSMRAATRPTDTTDPETVPSNSHALLAPTVLGRPPDAAAHMAAGHNNSVRPISCLLHLCPLARTEEPRLPVDSVKCDCTEEE